MTRLVRVPVKVGVRVYQVADALSVTRVRWLNTKVVVGTGYDFARADYIGQVNGRHFCDGPKGTFLLSHTPGPLADTVGAVLEVQYEAAALEQPGLFGSPAAVPRQSSGEIPLCEYPQACELGGVLRVRGMWLCAPHASRAAGVEWGHPRRLAEYEAKLKEVRQVLGDQVDEVPS